MMPGNYLFEYAVIRVVPHVEREEFINVGVILYCSQKKFLQTRISLPETKLQAIANGLDISELKNHVDSFERICRGGNDGGPIGRLSMPERFRWLTAARSTILQTSKVHPGLLTDPTEVIDRLFRQLVL
jgi:hypothetical protein